MSAPRLTLAQQLAQIAEPAPADFDPEDSYSTYAHERSTGTKNTDKNAPKPSDDYAEVGTSKLRKRGEAVVDSKYDGRKGSRKEFESGEFGGGSDDDDDEGDGSEGQNEEEDGSDEEMGDFADLEGGNDDEEEMEHDDEEDDEPALPPPPTTKAKKSSSSKREANEDADTKAMVKQLKAASSADVEKGRDVKKQLAFTDNLLEARIKLQKATLASNALPRASKAPGYFAAAGIEEVEDVLKELQDLNEQLFDFRSSLISQTESLSLPAGDFGKSRKRARGPSGDAGDYLTASLSDLAALESTLDPYTRSTLLKWSNKVLSASGVLPSSSSTKFKAIHASPLSQLDQLSLPTSSERQRLVARTRVNRASGAVHGKKIGEEEVVVLEGEKREREDVETYDDSDWYGQMLRDVVESRMLDLDDPTLESLRQASARGKKVKNIVDTRASKGRKIRYHVHEKVQNFMIPIEHGGWHDEQIDELFASLLGRVGAVTGASIGAGEEENKNGGGSLRIFG